MKPYYPPPLCTGYDSVNAILDPEDMDWDHLADCYAAAVADAELIEYLRNTGHALDRIIDGYLSEITDEWWTMLHDWLLHGKAPH